MFWAPWSRSRLKKKTGAGARAGAVWKKNQELGWGAGAGCFWLLGAGAGARAGAAWKKKSGAGTGAGKN